METIKLSLDREMFWQKPAGKDVPKINNRIAGCVHAVSPTEKGMRDLAEKIGIDGHTFCPATFKDGIRNQAHFEQQQFIALDFDSKTPDTTITLEDARARAERYGLRPVFAYDTLTSTNHNKFRMVFLNDTSICHRKVAEAVQLALGRYLFQSLIHYVTETYPRCTSAEKSCDTLTERYLRLMLRQYSDG